MDINIFLLIIAASLVILTSIGILSLFESTCWIEQIIFFFVISSANIIIATLVVSLFKGINLYGYLIIHTIFLSSIFAIIRLTGKKFFPPFPQVDLSKFRELKKHSTILILGMPFLVFVIISAFLILSVPPNNWDSMTYHLSKVGFWLQNGSMDFFPTYNPRQNYTPPNAEILIMWPIAFIKSDILAGFVQFIGYLGTILLVYGIALELGASRNQSIFAGLVWASIPEVMLEATSTQNDIIATFFLMASIFFMLRGSNDLSWKGFMVSGISFGLSVGAKGLAIFAVPGIFIGALLLFYKTKDFWRGLAMWIASTSVGIIIFGSYSYIQNYIHYGTFFGSKAAVADTKSTISNMFYSLYHISYRFLDASGIPLMKIPGFYPTPPIHEDFAGYGLVWFVLGAPAFFYAFYKGFFKRDFLKAGFFIIALSYLLVFSYLLPMDPFRFRLLIPFTAMVCPLVSFFYPKVNSPNNKSNWQNVVFIGVAVVGAIQVFVIAFSNTSKPVYFLWKKTGFELYRLADKKSIFEMDFYEKRFMAHSKIPEMMIFRELDKIAKSGSRIGVIASGDDWDYPAFGKRFDRKVIPIVVKGEDVREDIFTKYNLDCLIAYAPIQDIENDKVDIMPFLEQLLKQRGNSISFMRAGNIFLFVK